MTFITTNYSGQFLPSPLKIHWDSCKIKNLLETLEISAGKFDVENFTKKFVACTARVNRNICGMNHFKYLLVAYYRQIWNVELETFLNNMI